MSVALSFSSSTLDLRDLLVSQRSESSHSRQQPQLVHPILMQLHAACSMLHASLYMSMLHAPSSMLQAPCSMLHAPRSMLHAPRGDCSICSDHLPWFRWSVLESYLFQLGDKTHNYCMSLSCCLVTRDEDLRENERKTRQYLSSVQQQLARINSYSNIIQKVQLVVTALRAWLGWMKIKRSTGTPVSSQLTVLIAPNFNHRRRDQTLL